MTEQEMRIEIAKACGWTASQLPAYTTDLNAMNEAEKVLTDEQYTSYSLAAFEDTSFTGWLFRIMVRRREEPDFRTHSASAYERAEAFLRTIGILIDD